MLIYYLGFWGDLWACSTDDLRSERNVPMEGNWSEMLLIHYDDDDENDDDGCRCHNTVGGGRNFVSREIIDTLSVSNRKRRRSQYYATIDVTRNAALCSQERRDARY